MKAYYSKKYSHMTLDDIQRHWHTPKSHMLEVYCSDQSQLTQQGQNVGLSSYRFGLRHGDLSQFSGKCKLYDLLWTLRPRHVWLAPKCGPWSSWNRLNSMKSMQLSKQIQDDRRAENVHLLLCDALFRLQDWRGDTFLFHLEQPAGSEMLHQSEMENIMSNTLRVSCDMCIAGL